MNKNMLGRIYKPDPRDLDHLMAAARPFEAAEATLTKTQLRYLASGKRTHNYGKDAPIWDQGQTSRCVSFGSNRWLIAWPVRNRPWEETRLVDKSMGVLDGHLTDFYDECQKVDGIPGRHDGTTVRAAMKVLQAAGYVGEYKWAFDVPSITRHLLLVGPVVAGTDWTNPMFDPVMDEHGEAWLRVAPGGTYDVAGGHCYLVYGVNAKAKCPDGSVGYFEMVNSWGNGWGCGGTARIPFRDMTILANNQGEYATATEVKVTKVR